MAKPYKQFTEERLDGEIITQCRNGDKQAYRLLIDRYKDTIYSTALRFTRDPSTAEEVTQETFVKAWKYLDRFEGRSKFSTWLISIAVNKAKDMIKDKHRAVNTGDLDNGNETSFFQSHTIEGPEETLMNDELGLQLQRLIDALPALYKEAFVLRHVELLSYEEISGISKISIEAVKMRVFRAREILKKQFYEEDHDG
ncbi:MAG: sigma-70 family RNA polymerase sigma factor [Deltaproteobacteria bacterium]|nr:sigma-70 family RNA polymerase sigma factor [Deltaproteobacteria bacterium]